MRRRPRGAGMPPGDVNGALEPGGTRRLAPSEEEEPFKRDELPFEERPTYTGGEYGGGYGPTSGEGGGAEAGGGSSEGSAALQTQTLMGADYARALWGSGPSQPIVTPAIAQQLAGGGGSQTAVRVPTSILLGPSAPAPAPAPTSGAHIAA